MNRAGCYLIERLDFWDEVGVYQSVPPEKNSRRSTKEVIVCTADKT